MRHTERLLILPVVDSHLVFFFESLYFMSFEKYVSEEITSY